MSTKVLEKIIFSDSIDKVKNIINKGIKFSHYTSAVVGLAIIENGVVWLRNASLMNDYSEIIYGENLFREYLEKDDRGEKLSKILFDIHPDVQREFWARIDVSLRHRIENTYITCLSEHGSGSIDEEKYGRLSMWRAYGGNQNVALIINNDFLHLNTEYLGLFSIPVLYMDSKKYEIYLDDIINNIKDNIETIKEQNTSVIINALYFFIHCLILSTKHIGFSEEREWRIIYSPGIYTCKGDAIDKSIEIINGIPQIVCKLNLNNIDGIPQYLNLIDSIIIGPTKYESPIRDAFISTLDKKGAPDPKSKIKASGIPLRT